MEREVTLMEMLQAREVRVQRQQDLLKQYGQSIISFCMNIPGPVKQSPLICRGFREGLERLDAILVAAGIPVTLRKEIDVPTGYEALWVVDAPGSRVKRLCIELEEEDALGRLFDVDVLDPMRGKWDRECLGQPPRACMVCGKVGKECASRRLHTLEELRQATDGILNAFFARKDRKALSAAAARALLYEVCTTPKPGLVDRANNGSHQDMSIFTFLDSTVALLPYFEWAVELGQQTAQLPPEETFWRLRRAGVRGEREMFQATDGVNTHKGVIFSLGTVCAAAGRLWNATRPAWNARLILQECSAMSAQAVERDFSAMGQAGETTVGRRLYLKEGVRGIRGEVADGLPAVRDIGLPTLEHALENGSTIEDAGATALAALIAQVTDTNLISRGGESGLTWAAEQARAITANGRIPSRVELEELDRAFIERNLSPGGCADLLAISYFLLFVTDLSAAN